MIGVAIYLVGALLFMYAIGARFASSRRRIAACVIGGAILLAFFVLDPKPFLHGDCAASLSPNDCD